MRIPTVPVLLGSLLLSGEGLPSGAENQLVSSGPSCDNIHDCRTLVSIITSCLATLFACTWVSVHPNIPHPRDGKIMLALRRLNLMVLAIMAPEVIVVWALRQRMVARNLSEDFEMTMVHGFFVSMGGFVTVKDHGALGPVTSHMVVKPLNGVGVTAKDINDISEEAISDRSKGDALSKGIALLQTAWFLVQIIARRVQGLPILELEIVTSAFAAINVVIYLIWWNKPLDVKIPILIGPPPPSPVTTPHSGLGNLAGGEKDPQRHWSESLVYAYNYSVNSTLAMFIGDQMHEDIPIAAERVPTLWAGRLKPGLRGKAAAFGVFMAMGFGGIHVAAWNSFFPSEKERILWRVGSVAVVGVPGFFLIWALILVHYYTDMPEWLKTIFHQFIPLGVIVYIAGRGLLIVLPLVSLRSPPPYAYEDVDWTGYMYRWTGK